MINIGNIEFTLCKQPYSLAFITLKNTRFTVILYLMDTCNINQVLSSLDIVSKLDLSQFSLLWYFT